MDTERFEIKTKENYKIQQNRNSILYKILYLQIINLLLIIHTFFYKNKNTFLNIRNKQIEEKNTKGIGRTTSEKIKYLKILTNNNKNEYKGIQECLLNDPDKKLCIYHLILPKEVVGKKRILLGEKDDGCYVLLDDFENIKYAYSFGIYTNIQFDKALADKGIDVYMYDHTIMWNEESKSKYEKFGGIISRKWP